MQDNINDEFDEWDLATQEQANFSDKSECNAHLPYDVLSTAQLQKKVQKMQEAVVSRFNVSEEAALTLLIANKWNLDKLLLSLTMDATHALQEGGVQVTGDGVAEGTNPGVCSVCLELMKEGQSESLICGHKFCADCWVKHCEKSVHDGSNCIRAQCPQQGCNIIIPLSFMKVHLPSALFALYVKHLLKSYVHSSKTIKWCPGADCECAVERKSEDVYGIECTCGHAFCFACIEELHHPCSCEELREWKSKSAAESANAMWIATNTKTCPACGVVTNRVEGCNHITCRYCNHEYCWMCKGNWKTHGTETGGFYTCNIYEKQVQQEGKLKTETALWARAQGEIGRYAFHYARYDNHHLALKVAHEDSREVERFIDTLSARLNYPYSELEFLRTAADVVIAARRVLQYSYVHAFYLADPIQIELFRYCQGLLEENCDHLHELLHHQLSYYANLNALEFNLSTFYTYKLKLNTYSTAIKKFVHNFDS